AGSEPTEIETAGTSEEAVTAAVPDITQPDPDTVANNLAAGMDFDPESYAQSRRDSFQKQVDEGAMRLARRFALEIDPNSGEAQKFFENYYAQVASARNDLEASIATETAQIQQGNLAAVTGLIGTQGNLNIQKAQLSQRATELFGGEGTATLSSLGVPSMPDKYEKPDAFADADPKGFKQWINKIETSFFKENGRMPTDGELESLANGQAVVGKPTLAYQELVQRNQEFLATQRLAREEATGLITFAGMDTPTASLDRERFTETQREFDALQARQAQEWADKLGLDEAQVEDMLKTSAFQRDQTARMNSFSIASQMAELTGVAGFGTEDVTANTFGIQTDSIPEEVLSNNQALAQRPEFRALQQAARDLTGRELSGDQALSILRGDSVRMQGIPTLQSRQLAAEVTRSNQQYALDVERIAAENGLAADQLEMAMDQDARAWNQQTGRVSEEFGIPTDRYRTWKFGLDKQLLRAGTEQERQGILADSIEQFMEANPDLDVNAGDLIAANDMFDRLYGNDQLNIARQRGMQDEQWEMAKEQADLMDEQQQTVWAGVLGLEEKYQYTQSVDVGAELPQANENLLTIWDDFAQDDRLSVEIADDIINNPNYKPILAGIKSEMGTRWTEREDGKTFTKNLVTDNQMQSFLTSWIDSAKEGTPGQGVQVSTLPADWITDLSQNEKELLLSIVNRSAYSPERQSSGWLEAGMGLGQIAATLISAGIGG
ncbi:MAG: hypothetical protein ABIH23_10850, partial [bacterium]